MPFSFSFSSFFVFMTKKNSYKIREWGCFSILGELFWFFLREQICYLDRLYIFWFVDGWSPNDEQFCIWIFCCISLVLMSHCRFSQINDWIRTTFDPDNIWSGQHLIRPVFLKRFVSRHCTLVLFAFRSSHTTTDQVRSKTKLDQKVVYLYSKSRHSSNRSNQGSVNSIHGGYVSSHVGFYKNTIKD